MALVLGFRLDGQVNVSTHGLLLGPGGELILIDHAVAVRIEPREHLLEGGLLLVPELLLPLLHRRTHRARPLRRARERTLKSMLPRRQLSVRKTQTEDPNLANTSPNLFRQ
eukprot:COSAG04_NODE_2669_length_3757_cov_4.647348_8_plen_111_part_00